MLRKPDPTNPYRVRLHKDKGYRYASTQPGTVNPETGKREYTRIHWGTVDENLRFHPNSTYILATAEERSKLIFPEGWDLSETKVLPGLPDASAMIPEGQNENRLYGDSWLLMEIAKITGVFEDLCSVFRDNINYANIVLTIAFFLIIERDSYHNIEEWPNTRKLPYDNSMNSKFITEFTQNITEQNRMDFLKCRAARLNPDEICAVDSTSRSAWGSSLAEIKYGYNKDHLPLPQTVEVVVYTLSQHGPVYYRIYPGNMTDSRSLKTIKKDLNDAGFKNFVLITDRGYETLDNLDYLIEDGQKLIMATKINQKFVLDKIKNYGMFNLHPESMKLDRDSKLYYEQFEFDFSDVNKKSTTIPDRLKLNIYLNSVDRAEKLLEIELTASKQKTALEKIKTEQTALGDDESIGKDYSYYDIDLDKEKRTVNDFSFKHDKYEKHLMTAGFFANTTHKLDFDSMTANHHYKLRDEQEKYFTAMKTRLGENRQRVWSEEGKTGRSFVLFVTLIISCYFDYIHRTKLKDKFATPKKVLACMRPIRYIEHQNTKAYITPFIGKQIDICKAFGIEIPEGCAPAYAMPAQPAKKRGRPRKDRAGATNS
ncbi:MAG: transposase [Desulfovibrio sp.]|nr:transposase [Desulfovibrio sp.]